MLNYDDRMNVEMTRKKYTSQKLWFIPAATRYHNIHSIFETSGFGRVSFIVWHLQALLRTRLKIKNDDFWWILKALLIIMTMTLIIMTGMVILITWSWRDRDDHYNADEDHDNVHNYLITSLVVRVRSVSAWQHGNEVVHVLSPHF